MALRSLTSPEPLTAEEPRALKMLPKIARCCDVEGISARHHTDPDDEDYCLCGQAIPCDAWLLLAEVRRLREELEDSRVHVQTLAGQLVRARRELVALRPIATVVAGAPCDCGAYVVPQSTVLAARAWRDKERGQ